MTALIFSMSVGVAHADPTFVLVESQAHAGQAVHFTISGAEDEVTYELEVAGRDVLEGEADGDAGVIAGQFTMPDLGGSVKSVQVEAEIRDDGDDETTVKRKLQYLGPAPAVSAAPTTTAPAQLAAPGATPESAPAQSPAATTTTPSKPAAAVERRSKRKRRQARERRAVKRRDDTSKQRRSRSNRQSRRDKRASRAKPKRRTGDAPRTAPLFDGVPESQTGGYSAADDARSQGKQLSVKPPAAVLATPVAAEGSGQHATAILVPGLLALAAFILLGATLLRKRRTR